MTHMTGMIDISGFADKSSKDPQVLALYEQHDYLTAYAKHTDQRVQADTHLAIGGQWDKGGNEQLEFLKCEHQLTPNATLLDVGCGTGRFARKIVPYLDDVSYHGLDISPAAIRSASELSFTEGWAKKSPLFAVSDGTLKAAMGGRYDVVWIYSVFIHLPQEAIDRIFADLGNLSFDTCYFSYKPHNVPLRTGLKQFRCPFVMFETLARKHGLVTRDIPNPAAPMVQRMGMVRHVSAP